jgi:hypothetical protein
MSNLIESLISSGLLNTEAVITATIPMATKWGSIRYTSGDYQLKYVDNDGRLVLKEIYSETTLKADTTTVTAVDGMALARFADVCNVNADGSTKPIQRKRGRKPKNRMLSAL